MIGRFGKVIATNPPGPPGYVANKDSMGGFGQLFPAGAPPFPPLDLVYLASYLAAKGVPVDVVEAGALALAPAAFVERVASLSAARDTPALPALPALVVVRTSAPTLDWDLRLCQEIKAAHRDTAVAVYGPVVPHVRRQAEQAPGIDYLVEGEPDETVLELVAGREAGSILGLSYREHAGWCRNPDRPLITALDALPFPQWELFPYERYRLPRSSARPGELWLPMLTSRGCPAGCHYCPYPVGQGVRWRTRSPHHVVDEIERLGRDLGVRRILFRDPIFSLNQRRVLEICDEILRRGLDVEWRCETRVDCLSDDTLRAMARAGCRGLNFGVESADVEIQSGVGRKPISPEEFRATIALCRALGIRTFGFFIIGLPGDTVESILRTIRLAIELRPNWVQFTAASPFIGTKLRDWAVARGLVGPDEYTYVSSHQAQMGNERLSRAQVQSLLRFAQRIQHYLINRQGLLKDEHGRDGVYRRAKEVADRASLWIGRAVFAVGARRFRRWEAVTP